MADGAREALERWVRPGCTIAIADGVGAPSSLYADLSLVAAATPNTRLILGWCPELPATLDLRAFGEIRAFMPGPTLRRHVEDGTVKYVPANVSQLPALFAERWRPDVLIMSVCESRRGLNLGSEASWIKTAARTAGVCLAELNRSLPNAARDSLLHGVALEVIRESRRPPFAVPAKQPDDTIRQLGEQVAQLVPAGSAVQFGPGPIATAFVSALQVPVRVDSGIITDAVVDLHARGLLDGQPLGTYLSGTRTLYDWADGLPILDGVDVTHDATRLSSTAFVAVNTALEVDLIGQVALEGTSRVPATGIGGHTDYAYAASRSAQGLSIIALPSHRGGHSTLKERLTRPVCTPRSLVDVIVTEHGWADLRGLTDAERRDAISRIFV